MQTAPENAVLKVVVGSMDDVNYIKAEVEKLQRGDKPVKVFIIDPSSDECEIRDSGAVKVYYTQPHHEDHIRDIDNREKVNAVAIVGRLTKCIENGGCISLIFFVPRDGGKGLQPLGLVEQDELDCAA